jgi:hypothetical protein
MGNTCGEEWASSLGKIIVVEALCMLDILFLIEPSPSPVHGLTKKVCRIVLKPPIGSSSLFLVSLKSRGYISRICYSCPVELS